MNTGRFFSPKIVVALIMMMLLALLGLLDATTSVAHATPPPQEGEATLRVVNESEETVCFVLITLVTASEWGDNWLGENETIPPGATASFDLAAGDYHVLLANCEGNVLLDERGLTISGLYELRFTGSDLCKAMNQEGMTSYRQAKYVEAIQQFQDALACYRDAGHRAGEGRTLSNIGAAYRSLGQYQEALSYSEQALTIRQEIGDRAGEGTTLNNIGAVYQYLGQYQEALGYYEGALTIRQEIGDRAGEGATLNNIGLVYDSLGQYEAALGYYEGALTISQEIGHRAGEGNTLNNIGLVYQHLGQYQESLGYYEGALTISQEIGDRAGEGTTLNNIGGVYRSLGQYQEALGYLEQALTILQEIGDRAGEGATLNGIGVVYQDLGQYQEALGYLEQALTIRQEIGHRAGEGATITNIGVVYESLGQYQEALSYHQQALTIRQEIGDRAGQGATLANIGAVYRSLGQYQEALGYYERALTILQEIGDRAGEGATLSNIGAVYYSLGQYQEALGYYEKALTIGREIGDRAGEGAALNNIGLVYHHLGQYQEALGYYEGALTIFQEIGHREGEGTMLNNIGLVYHHLGQYQEALGYYERALTIYQEIGDRAGEGTTLNNIGGVYDGLGQYQEALGYLEQALTIYQEIGDRAGEGTTLNNIGRVYDSLGRYQEALDHFERAIAVAETIRGEMTVEEFKSGFAAEHLSPYRRIIPLLIEMDRPLDAFHYVQRAKARTFLDQLGNARPSPSTTNDPRLVEEEETLRGEIQALDAQLREEWARPPEQRSDEAIQSLTVQLAQKRHTYTQLLTRLKLENPEYASLVTVETLTLTQTQQLLTATTLVEYYVLPEQTLAFVVAPDSFYTEAISVTRQALFGEISTFYLQTQASLEGIPSSTQNLYDLLIAPVEPHLNTRSLVIAPHSVLHYVPFAALHNGEKCLVEQHTLTQLPSASILPFILEKRKASVGSPLVLGDPDGSLPFSRQEAQAVAGLYNTTAHVGNQALEQLVWEQGPEAGILHLSTHGIYNAVSPLFSRLLLAPDAEEKHDGYLEVHEVFNLDLHNADLVVLSACQTNLGERSAGDEIVGLNRAFIYAGTPSVLATLWSVEDAATKDLMVAFYGYLDEGYAKGEALRQAQVDVLQNPDTAHPYYWAGFVLTGDVGEGKVVEDAEEREPIEKAEEVGTTEGTEVESTDAPDFTRFWFGGVGLLLIVIGSGVWMMWKRSKSHV